MQYREIQVAAPISNDVECLWLLEGEASPAGLPERLLPDGCVELILNFGEPTWERKEDGQDHLQPSRFMVGQTTRPILVMPRGPLRLLGIRFKPGGTLPFLSLPPNELTNVIVPLEDIATPLDREITGRIDETGDLVAMAGLLETALRQRRSQDADRGTALRNALERIVRSGGQFSVDRLASDFGMSGRQLERLFSSRVGIGPKLLGRILRFQQVFHAVERSDLNWARIAVECGYYDQSHLIRDFRQFAGHSPTALVNNFTRMTEIFMRKRRKSDFSNISD